MCLAPIFKIFVFRLLLHVGDGCPEQTANEKTWGSVVVFRSGGSEGILMSI